MLKYVPFYITDFSTKAATFATIVWHSTGSRMSDDSQTDKASYCGQYTDINSKVCVL